MQLYTCCAGQHAKVSQITVYIHIKKPLQISATVLDLYFRTDGNYLPDMTPWSLKVRVGTNSPNL